MASPPPYSFRYLCTFQVLIFNLQIATAVEPNTAFLFKNFSKDSTQLSMYGNAMVANDSMSIQLASSGASRTGMIIYKKPINLIELNSGNMVSFSNYFVFSIGKGSVLAFIMLPFGFPSNLLNGGSMGILGKRKNFKFLAVKFYAFKDEKYGDGDSVVSIKVSNVSSINLMLSNGEKLQSWIDYGTSSKRLELRLNKLGEEKPVDSLISYPIDLSKLLGEKRVSVGLSSLSGYPTEGVRLYLWSLRTRSVPHWMHSEPSDVEDLMRKGEEVKVGRRSGGYLRTFSALIFGIGCGVLVAFLLLIVWIVIGNRRQMVVPEEFSGQKEKPLKMVRSR